MAPADYLRLRFRELMHDAGVSQITLCKRLEKRTGEKWRESRLSKMLNGRIAWEVDDLVVMAECAGISLVELFRAKGREFVADLTPSEMQLLLAIREHQEIGDPLTLVINRLAALQKGRKVPRAILRERIRRDKREDGD